MMKVITLLFSCNLFFSLWLVSTKPVVQFDSSSISSDVTFSDFEFKIRETFPAGPGDMYGYGLGALEQISYDSSSQILYGMSEQGYLNIFKFTGDSFEVLDLSISFNGSLTDVEVCNGYLFVSLSQGTDEGEVYIYNALAENEITVPELVGSVTVGVGPDKILPNPECTILAVANEGEGDYDDYLVDPVGSISLVSNFDSPIETKVPIDIWTDDELISKGVHMPLPKLAMDYWDKHSDIAADINFNNARNTYSSDMNLEPEYLAWSVDGKTLFVNLQENSAVIVVNITSETEANVVDIFSYGLKDWSGTPIDVFEDGGCDKMEAISGLYSIRTPDSIASVEVDGKTYILTANEGDDKEYGDYEEKVKSKNIFDGNEIGLANMTADSSIFDPSDSTLGTSAMFNADCDGTSCATSMRMTVGSSMINYSDPIHPRIMKMVAFGGRGISIYELTSSYSLDLIWDSGSDFETFGCENFPWAHNGIQDEEFAPIHGALYNISNDDLKETIEEMSDPDEDGCEDGGDGSSGACPMGQTVDERSMKDGYAAESVVVGEACGQLFAVTVSEKNSVGFVYQISDITAPSLVKVFHLSNISRTLNPGLAYRNGLGEIDAESIIFLNEAESPSGNAGVLFAGAWSGTVSWWEFTCDSSSYYMQACVSDDDCGTLQCSCAQTRRLRTKTNEKRKGWNERQLLFGDVAGCYCDEA